MQPFFDPAYRAGHEAIAPVAGNRLGRVPRRPQGAVTAKAGPGFADHDYELSVQSRETRDKLVAAQQAALSHDALDADTGVQEEVRNVARAVAAAVRDLRDGRLQAPDRALRDPRPK